MKRLIFTSIVFFLTCFPFQGKAWVSTIRGSANLEGAANSVVVDRYGDVIAAGVIANVGTGPDFAVVKLDGDTGRELWRAVINGTENGPDVANSVTVDSEGDVIAAGETRNRGTGSDFTVAKFDGETGKEMWRVVIDSPGHGYDSARKVITNFEDDVIAIGQIANTDMIGDFILVKLDGKTGEEIGRTLLDTGEAESVTADGQGNIIAAGTIGRGLCGVHIIIKSGNAGERLWRRFTTGSDMTVDGQDNLIAVGGARTRDPYFSNFLVSKLDGTNGRLIWKQEIIGRGNGARSVAVDSEGNIISAGALWSTFSRFGVIKLNGENGRVIWRSPEFRGFQNGARKAVVDNRNDVVAMSEDGFVIFKFNGRTGAELWRVVIEAPGSVFPAPGRDVVVDVEGNVIGAGQRTVESIKHFAVVKRRGIDGSDF